MRTLTATEPPVLRVGSLVLLTTASALLLSAFGEAAVPTSLPGACALGGNCVAYIANGSSLPQPGDPGISLGSGGTGVVTLTVPGAGLVGGGPNLQGNFLLGGSGGTWTTLTRTDHPTEFQTISVLASDGLLHATQFDFSVGAPVKRTSGSKRIAAGPGTGTATMFPHNADGFSTGMTLQGTMTNGSPWPITSVSFVLSDPRGTGHFEYIGMDLAVMLSIMGAGKSNGLPIGMVWVPLSAPTGSGNPTVVSVDPGLGPGGTFYTSDFLAPANGNQSVVPALSTWGVAGLTLLLAATGFLQLRKAGFQLGL